MKKTSHTIYKLVIISVFTSIIAVLSSVPIGFNILGVPATLQTFAITFAGFLLGYKNGTLCVLIYIIAGLTGLPVFNGFKGGFSVLFGVTGGFIPGFLFLVFFSGIGMNIRKIRNSIILAAIRIFLSAIGLMLCHLMGSMAAGIYLDSPTLAAASIISLPYLPKDILSIIISYASAMSVKKALTVSKLNRYLK